MLEHVDITDADADIPFSNDIDHEMDDSEMATRSPKRATSRSPERPAPTSSPAHAPSPSPPPAPENRPVGGFSIGDFVHTFMRRGTKGTKSYEADWEVGRITSFVGSDAHLEWWHYCTTDNGTLTGDFVPMPADPAKPFIESVRALGAVTVLDGPNYDDETEEKFVTLDFDAIDQAVQADLRQEEKADGEKRSAQFYQGGRPAAAAEKTSKKKRSAKAASQAAQKSTDELTENDKKKRRRMQSILNVDDDDY